MGTLERVNGPSGEIPYRICQYLDLTGEDTYIPGDKLKFVNLETKVDGLEIVNVTALKYDSDDFSNEQFFNLSAKYQLQIKCTKSRYPESDEGKKKLDDALKGLFNTGSGDYQNKITDFTIVESGDQSYTIDLKLAEENVGIENITSIELVESSFTRMFWDQFMGRIINEGVCYSPNRVPNSLRDSLRKNANNLAISIPVDYHPNSQDIVRDLVHPALYPYIKGVSQLKKDCVLPDKSGEEAKEDFWGRPYEDSNYQWLPTPFYISSDGKCTIKDYINNLDQNKFMPLYKDLEQLFEIFLPYFEEVWNYIKSIRFYKNEDDAEACEEDEGNDIVLSGYTGEKPSPENFDISTPVPQANLFPDQVKREKNILHDRELQVIVKIVDYTLQPQQAYEGVWHAEGMSHENIVMTGIYFIDRDSNLDGGNLKFKRAFTNKERNATLYSVPQGRPMQFNEFAYEGFVPLGHFPTEEGYMLVFPNCHIHKIGKMINKASDKTSSRRIIVFFVVNPDRKIISTREIAPQQDSIPLTQAKAYRLELMAERKYDKEKLNVRDIELCEH